MGAAGGKFGLYTLWAKPHVGRLKSSPLSFLHHGQPQEEAPSQDEQAQAPQALEIESPQEAHVAKVTAGICRASPSTALRSNPPFMAGFFAAQSLVKILFEGKGAVKEV